MNKKSENFGIGLIMTVAAISISLFSFMTEEKSITGFAAASVDYPNIETSNLIIFNDVHSLSVLSAGNYYIDGNGIVYWTDDEITPPVASIKNVDELQKNKYIYIDAEGNIGYILESISINE